jgi:hypothetical protein
VFDVASVAKRRDVFDVVSVAKRRFSRRRAVDINFGAKQEESFGA